MFAMPVSWQSGNLPSDAVWAFFNMHAQTYLSLSLASFESAAFMTDSMCSFVNVNESLENALYAVFSRMSSPFSIGKKSKLL